ncbi:MAG: hypothetical protein KKB13_17560, partial [Chloroflexi bacterium]|nr:hypothetical protein [Chloroflexota bacterium]
MLFPLVWPAVFIAAEAALGYTIFLPLVVGAVIGRTHMNKRTALLLALALVGLAVVALAGWGLPPAQSGGLLVAGDRPVARLASGQSSQPWGGVATGDAGPYDDDDWSDMYAILFTADRATQGVISTTQSSYAGLLAVTSPNSVTVRTASGAAVVDGKFYWSDGNVDQTIVVPGSGSNYYRIVLRKSWSAQTVRNTLVGPETGSYPSLTQTDGT